jgi:hypothetical protein
MHHARLLWSGARISLPLPMRFDRLPHLHAVVSPGTGGRQLCFFPSPRFEGPEALEHLERTGTVPGRNGRSVEMYTQIDAPEMQWLVWRLGSGFAVVTLNPEQVHLALRFAGAIAVDEGPDGLPQASYGSGVAGGNTRFPFQRDVAKFLAGDGDVVEMVTVADLGRPGRTEPAFESGAGQVELARVTDRYKVSWAGPASRRDEFDALLQSTAADLVVTG